MMPTPTPFDREVCTRLPLAEACLRLLDFVTAADFLAELFDRHRGNSHEQVLSFGLFVHLIGDALLQHQGSAYQAFTRAREDGDLTTSYQAVYGKLARLPLSLSQGFLAESSQRLLQVVPTLPRSLPASLRRFQVCPIDGKKIKQVAKRLKPLRRLNGNLLGGKLVVGLHLNSGLALAFQADADGHRSDTPLTAGLLRQLRRQVPGPRLFLLDRLFCDLGQPELLSQDGDHFVLRYCAKVNFYPDAQRPAQEGTDAQGRRYVQQWGWLGGPKDPRRRYLRRVTLYRPGEEDVCVLTDLVDEKLYPAEDILAVYLLRWGIERCFQDITEVFGLARLIGGTPQATVFQASFCLLLYNVVQVVRGFLAETQTRAAEEVSLDNVFTDVKRQLIAWSEVLSPQATLALLRGQATAAQLQQRLREVLAEVWTDRWLKAPTKKGPWQKPPPRQYVKGGHASVYRLLQKARQQEREKAPL